MHNELKVPLVSVCCITYNHEAFLTQAIESVLMQETDFAVEMVIGEDCSPDRTRQIALDYQARFPGRVRVLTPAANLGIMRNLMETMAACTGEYIAFMEGDDYWTDPAKLQLQVDTMRANPTCSFCFHDAESFRDVDNVTEWTFGEEFSRILPRAGSPPQLFTQLDLAQHGWFIPSASMLFRATSLALPLPDWFKGVYSGDYTLQLLSTKSGPAIYLPRVMSRYRMHDQSIGSTMAQSAIKFERRIYEAKMFQEYVFKPENKKHADIYLAMQYHAYAKFLGRQGKKWQQLQYLAKASYYDFQRLPLYIERRLQQTKQTK
jgi:glycosyltransferase involved in cell wall biosynthesis